MKERRGEKNKSVSVEKRESERGGKKKKTNEQKKQQKYHEECECKNQKRRSR